MNRFSTILGLLTVLAAAVVTGCDNKADDTVSKCELYPELPECGAPEGCDNPPFIERVEFAPKEGRIPLKVVFDLVAEDLDTKFCSDVLTYHIDVDGDGYADYKEPDGRGIEHTYREAGDFKVGIWVTDTIGNVSQKSVKLIKARPNQVPVISQFYAYEPTQGQVPFTAAYRVAAFDADGEGKRVKSLTIDYGDGAVATLTPDTTRAEHQYKTPGNFTATLKACDDSVCVERTADILAVTQILTSNFIQTAGTSTALSLDDNNGAHYEHPEYGLSDYVYVADGAIALKVIRMPIAAATTAETYEAPAHLTGMADGAAGNWGDIEHYKNLVAVAGNGGIQVFDVNPSGQNACEGPWDTNCHPGSVTQPVRICSPSDPTSGLFMPYNAHKKVDLYTRQGSNGAETWLVSGIGKGTSNDGGVGMFRLDVMAYDESETPSYYLPAKVNALTYTYSSATSEITVTGQDLSSVGIGDWVYDTTTMAQSRIASLSRGAGTIVLRQGGGFSGNGLKISAGYHSQHTCWRQTDFSTTSHQKLDANGFRDDVTDLKVDGGYAYVGNHQSGIKVVDLESFLSNGNLDSSATVPYNLGSDKSFPWGANWQPHANSLNLTYSERVTATLAVTDFKPATDGLACLESEVVNVGSWAGPGEATIITAKAISPGNRVAITLTEGAPDTNGGDGYLVTGNDGASTIVEPAPSSAPGSWSTVYTIPVSYAVLPKYSGANAVTLTTSQTGALVRNARCLNYLNAYEAVTAPVGVTYATAPLLIAAINSSGYGSGLLILDRSNPRAPKYLSQLRPSDTPTPFVHGISGLMYSEIYENRFYFGSTGLRSAIAPVDISNPHGAYDYYTLMPGSKNIGTFRYQTEPVYDYAINELLYYTPSSNPKGILLVAGGKMGLNAIDIADHLTSSETLVNACNSQSSDSPCMYPPGAQLRHDGEIRDISIAADKYALVAQKRGGVLVFDVSGATDGAEPQFVSHVRTTGDPVAVHVVEDGAGNVETLYVADTDSLYVVPFTDPSEPGFNHIGEVPGYDTRYVCTAYAGGRSFTCATATDGTSTAYVSGDDLVPSIPSIPLKFSFDYSYSPPNECTYSPDVTKKVINYFERMESGMLAGRLFIFGETGNSAYKNVIREIELDAQGKLALNGGYAVGCQINFQKNRGVRLSYQHRIGAAYSGQTEWKRLYTVESNGTLAIFSMDLFEENLQDPDFDINNGPALIRTLNLQDWNNYQALSVRRLIALGPYLFVAAGDEGAWIIDVSNALDPKVIGQSRISLGSGGSVNALNAIVFPTNPNDLDQGYTYLALIGITGEGGGIRLMRFPGLQAP